MRPSGSSTTAAAARRRARFWREVVKWSSATAASKVGNRPWATTLTSRRALSQGEIPARHSFSSTMAARAWGSEAGLRRKAGMVAKLPSRREAARVLAPAGGGSRQ